MRYLHVGAPGRQVVRTIQLGNGVLVDVDIEDRPTGVEIIGRCEQETAGGDDRR